MRAPGEIEDSRNGFGQLQNVPDDNETLRE